MSASVAEIETEAETTVTEAETVTPPTAQQHSTHQILHGETENETETGTGPSFSDGPPVRILCLGDSYTVGEAVAQELTWPYQVAAALQLPPGAVAVHLKVVATTGWTTDELMSGIEREV